MRCARRSRVMRRSRRALPQAPWRDSARAALERGERGRARMALHAQDERKAEARAVERVQLVPSRGFACCQRAEREPALFARWNRQSCARRARRCRQVRVAGEEGHALGPPSARRRRRSWRVKRIDAGERPAAAPPLGHPGRVLAILSLRRATKHRRPEHQLSAARVSMAVMRSVRKCIHGPGCARDWPRRQEAVSNSRAGARAGAAAPSRVT